jgi:hypothetical protein
MARFCIIIIYIITCNLKMLVQFLLGSFNFRSKKIPKPHNLYFYLFTLLYVLIKKLINIQGTRKVKYFGYSILSQKNNLVFNRLISKFLRFHYLLKPKSFYLLSSYILLFLISFSCFFSKKIFKFLIFHLKIKHQ